MIIKITIKEDEFASVWGLEKFVAKSDFPEIEASSSDKYSCVNAVNGAVRCGAVRCGAVRCGAVRCGAVLCVLGLWEKVPDKIEFKVRKIK